MRPLATAIALVLAVLLLWALWNTLGNPMPVAPGTTVPTVDAEAQRGAARGSTASVPAIDGEATKAAAERQLIGAASATTGELLVRVTWADDGKPAADVMVEVSRSHADALFDQLRGTTDAQGCVQFKDLAPGKVHAHLLRSYLGDKTWARAAIEAGKVAEAALAIGPGMNVRGLVVDGRNAPVADAEIVVADWGGSDSVVLAHSAADGTFALRAIGTHVHIGARSPGFSPSPLRQFTASPGANVELRIVLDEAGAELEGTVLDPQDRPLAGAVVQIGDRDQKNRTLPDGGSAMGPRPTVARTDARGRYAFAGLPTGKQKMQARARGLSTWQGELELTSGQKQQRTIHLAAGVTIFGTVKDEAGKPVAGADVDFGDWDDLGHRRLASGEDGNYRCEGLTAGRLRVQVSTDKTGKTGKDFDCNPGETIRWDPVLSRGLVFRGRVLDDAGKPVAEAMVEGRPEDFATQRNWWGIASTDAEGRFAFDGCAPDLLFTLAVKRKSVFPELQLEHQKPGGEELVIRLPKAAWVHIRGTVLGPDGTPLASVHVSPWLTQGNSGSPAETADAQGKFELGPYPPGEYQLALQADGYPGLQLGPRTLGPDENWDLGELRFARGGTLAVALVSDRAGPLPELSLRIEASPGSRPARVDIQDGRGRSAPLAPGEHVLQIEGKDIASARVPFVIEAGVETRLDVRLLSGVPVEIGLQLPTGVVARKGIACVLTDANGNVVLRRSAWGSSDRVTLQGCLLPGRYTFTAELDGCRGEAAFDVAAPGPVKLQVELQKK